MSLVLAPKRLFTGERLLEGAAVHIENGRVAQMSPTPPTDAIALDGLLAPGFIDIQVNGGGGVMFNDTPDVAALQTIARAHQQFGVTGFLATLISDERDKIRRAIDAVSEAVAAGLPGLIGLHLEGPWLSAPRRGMHPERFLRDFDRADLDLIAQQRPFPVLVTVAPERIGPEHIRTLSAAGIIVALGHTAAEADQIEAALDAGARGFTHLFNAMPPFEARRPGAVGAALAHDEAWTGIILDGIHVHTLAARVAFKCKTARKLMLVSDSMATVGAAEEKMSLFGEEIAVRDGALRTSAGTLAGAHLDLSAAMRNALSLIGASLEDALQMSSLSSATFLRLDNERGRIALGARADLVLLDDSLQAQQVWIGGERVR